MGTCTGEERCDNLFIHCLRVAQNAGCIEGTSVVRNDALFDADNISLPRITFSVPGAWEVSAQVHSLAVVKIYVCFRGSSSLLM